MAVSLPHGVVQPPLLVLLADGRLHSGEGLAEELGVSRAAVWKGVERLRAQGIVVQAEARRGYRLFQPVELLDAGRMRAELGRDVADALHALEIVFDVDSTNSRLLAAAPPPYGAATVCACELQSAGRGRRGRRWIAPFGASLAMSLAWTFRDAARDLPALSLAVGVAVARALGRVGAHGIGLKWPNDLWFEDKKIGGVLIELRAEAQGPAYVVIGIGINVALPPGARREIEASDGLVQIGAVTDACRASKAPPSRNRIAGATIDELLRMLAGFEREGFTPFREAWSALDALYGRRVRVLIGERSIVGLARGVEMDGAFCVDVEGRRQKFSSGEVSLRLEGQRA
ncbi:MAG: biotin--[acetyl-CoA-carboxylase] ligase [Steroidobacteraceae bacterium]|jgi:BirA family biotin operon repressor/biotin-[acetyl-CoA-carboxylase] ligase